MDYQAIIVGGGLGGAVLARRLAGRGVPTLVIERRTAFRDRVRGEQMHCWGAVEARRNGIYELLVENGGHEVAQCSIRMKNTPPRPVLNMLETEPHRVPLLHMYHPDMQSALLDAAEAAGATVRRGALVTDVAPGEPRAVRVREDGRRERTYRGRLVIGADGRESRCRVWGGFEVRRDPGCMRMAGVLLEDVDAPFDTLWLHGDSSLGRMSFITPFGGRRARAYVTTHRDSPAGQHRFGGERDFRAFVAASIEVGMPPEWVQGARMAGPLATFDCADRWVDHPYREGIALIGDAAASSDPSFGCGLSLTLRDVRVLADKLLSNDDWDAAARAYAAEHDCYYGAIHRLTGWMRLLLFDPTPEGALRRQRAFPRIARDPARAVDILGLGPEFPSDETARQRYFGED